MFEWLVAPSYPERQKVVVNTKDGQALQGILWQRDRQYLVLKSTLLVSGHEKPIPIDGDVIVERANVSFIQVLYGAV